MFTYTTHSFTDTMINNLSFQSEDYLQFFLMHHFFLIVDFYNIKKQSLNRNYIHTFEVFVYHIFEAFELFI